MSHLKIHQYHFREYTTHAPLKNFVVIHTHTHKQHVHMLHLSYYQHSNN